MSATNALAEPADLLVVGDLRTGFGANTVLHGVDFAVRRGEIVAILGLNGAGKSVTMKTIAGVVPAWAGEIALRGTPITSLPVERRVALGIAHVTQGRQVFPELSVEENLRLGAYLLRRRDKARYRTRLDDLYEKFPRLGERRAQAAGTLSGGEQAMLALARALIAEPALMLVDEPTAGLAPAIVDDLLESLRAVNRDGVTILLVEQHVPFALRLADRALIMQRGRIVYESTVAQIDEATMVRALGIGRLMTPQPEPKPKRKPAAKKPPAGKTAAKKAPAEKTAAKKAPAEKTAAKKAPAERGAASRKPAAGRQAAR